MDGWQNVLWGLGVGKLLCWVSCVRLDGTDGRLFVEGLVFGEISWWVIGARFDGTDVRLFGRQLVGER
jgi:hypothetical protein